MAFRAIRLTVANGSAEGGRQLAPGHAVRRPEEPRPTDRVDVEETLPRARVDDVGVGVVDGEGRHGEVRHQVVDRVPAAAAVVGAPHAAACAGRPDRVVLGGVEDDGTGPAADVAWSERDPVGAVQAGRRFDRQAQPFGGDVRAGGHAGDGVLDGPTYALAVELAHGVQHRVRGVLSPFVTSLQPPVEVAGPRHVGVLEPPERASQGGLWDRLDPRGGQAACLPECLYLLDAETLCSWPVLRRRWWSSHDSFRDQAGACQDRSGGGRRLTGLSRTVSQTGCSSPSRLAVRVTAVVPSEDGLAAIEYTGSPDAARSDCSAGSAVVDRGSVGVGERLHVTRVDVDLDHSRGLVAGVREKLGGRCRPAAIAPRRTPRHLWCSGVRLGAGHEAVAVVPFVRCPVGHGERTEVAIDVAARQVQEGQLQASGVAVVRRAALRR